MATIFSKIINREIPGHIVAEDELCIAFLDISPLTKGHTLVVPKKEVDYLFDLDEEHYLHVQKFAKKVAHALDKTVDCKRVGVAVLGMEVPHAHIHLIPLQQEGDLNFKNPRVKLSNEELNKLADSISQAVDL